MAAARAAVQLDTARVEAALARRGRHGTEHVALLAARTAQHAVVREVAPEPCEQRPPRVERVGAPEGLVRVRARARARARVRVRVRVGVRVRVRCS